MIIEMLLDVFFNVFELLTRPIAIPSLPDEINIYISYISNYLGIGASIVAEYTPFVFLMVLFGIIVYVDLSIGIYHLVMWILEKVPFIDVDR